MNNVRIVFLGVSGLHGLCGRGGLVRYSSDTMSREIYDSDSSTCILPKRPLVRYNQIQCLSTLSFGFRVQQSQRVSLSELPHLELSFTQAEHTPAQTLTQLN